MTTFVQKLNARSSFVSALLTRKKKTWKRTQVRSGRTTFCLLGDVASSLFGLDFVSAPMSVENRLVYSG